MNLLLCWTALVSVVALAFPALESNRRRTDRSGNVVALVAPIHRLDRSGPRRPAAYWQSQQSRDELKRLGGAIYQYLDTHNHFPADIKGKDGKPLLSWRVAILPYLDLDFLYAQIQV